jgi:Zn-dependent protease
MFIPGIGAVVRLQQYPKSPADDARVGLAGPLWGLGAAAACHAVYLVSGAPLWAALARSGAWINLFNLLPVWQLDGARGFHALARGQRWLAAAVILGAWLLTSDGILLLLLLFAVLRASGKDAPAQPDRGALALYTLLVAALSGLAWLDASR